MKKLLIICLLIFPISFSIPSIAKESLTDGKGIWVNVWNYPDKPNEFCEYLKNKDIDTLYLQISRSNTPAIYKPEELSALIKEAHKRKIKVIGWTYPYLKYPTADAKKFITAVNFRTPEGDKLDAVAADIEEVTDSKNIQIFASTLKREFGKSFPLIAITFSPMLKRAAPANYAWKTIADNFDILMPMTYWTWSSKYRSEQGAYNYTAQTIELMKQYTGKSDLNIHLIGDGQKTSDAEVKGFLRAASDYNISGISLYPFHKPTTNQIEVLSNHKLSYSEVEIITPTERRRIKI